MTAILTEISKFIPKCDFLDLTYVTEILLSFMHNAANSVKLKSASLLANILHFNHRSCQKSELISLLISEFAQSSKHIDRSLFLDFCLAFSKLCSRDYFSRYFLESLIALGYDGTKEVKYKFAINYNDLKHCVHRDDAESAGKFRKILNNFLENGDKILVELAIRAEDNMNSREWDEAYGDEGEMLDRLRYQFEIDQLEREARDIENNKNKILDELTSRSRQNFVNARHGNRHTVTSRTVTNKIPVKRYSFSDADKYEALAKSMHRTSMTSRKK